MKLLAMLSAGLVATAVLAATPAAADRGHRHRHRHGHGWKWKKVCKTIYSHGHRQKWCRNVRVRW